MLAIEIRFLLGRYSASDFRDRDLPEWPPHPARLFSAFVAAYHESELGESVKAALLWLENQEPPEIVADQSPAVQSTPTVFVPINDASGMEGLPAARPRRPRTFPSVVPEHPAVWFVWREANPDEILKSLLSQIAENVTYLGNSHCPVAVSVCETSPEPNWFPDDDGSEVIRVLGKGRLEHLEWQYENGQRPTSGAFQRYRIGTLEEPSENLGIFGELVIFRLGDCTAEIETTLKLTDALRAAAMSRADGSSDVMDLLSGHDKNGQPLTTPHAAYVALPFASATQEYADGHIMGLGVVLPRDLSMARRIQAVRVLRMIERLNVPGIGQIPLQRVMPGDHVPHNLRVETWCRPSARWTSVTPMLLDRFPKRTGRGLHDIISKSCLNIGLPAPVEIVADRYSPLFGVEPSFRFITSRPRSPKKSRLHTHVTVTFAEPIPGPLLLGAGRFFGMGLMRPYGGPR